MCTEVWLPGLDTPHPEGVLFSVEQVLHYPDPKGAIFQALDLECHDAYWKPGWYFWDETQLDVLGMWQNYQQALKAIKQYAQYLDDGLDPKGAEKAYWFSGQDGAPDNPLLNEWYDDAPLFVPIYETTLP